MITNRPAGNGELAQHPAVGKLVIDDNRVAVVVVLTRSGQSTKQGIDCGGSRQLRAALAKHRKGRVNHLHVLRAADSAIWVGRDATAAAIGLVYSFKSLARARDRKRPWLSLHDSIDESCWHGPIRSHATEVFFDYARLFLRPG